MRVIDSRTFLPAAAGGAAPAESLPEWKLDHLYPSMDSPQYRADLDALEPMCRSFAEQFRGKVAQIAARKDGAERLNEAVRAYEKIDDLLGRVISYAGLIYAGDTTDPARGKFYGDGWSTAHEPRSTYLVTSLVMLALVVLVLLVLVPWSTATLP